MSFDWIKRNGKRIILIGALLSAAECRKDLDLIPIEDPIETDTIIFHPETKVLNQESLEDIVEYNDSTIIFSDAAEYSNGDILIGGISEKTPYGFMKKVEEINGNTLIVSNTSLEEVIKKGKISFSKELGTGGLKYSNAGYEFREKINEIIYDQDNDTSTTDDQVRIEGEIYFNTGLNFDAEFDNGVKEIKFKAAIEGEISLDIIGNIDYNEIGRANLIEIPFPPIPTGVPAIIAIPKMNVYLNYDIDLHGDLKTGIETGIDISQETKYHPSSGWFTSKSIEPYIEWKNVVVNANADARVGLEERLTFILNGIGGPFVSAEEYLKFSADINKSPWWELSGGMNVNVGADPGLLSFAIPEYKENIFGIEILLLQADNYDEPIARIEANLTEGYAPLEVEFDASGSSSGLNITKYIFDFGDGEFYVEDALVNDGAFDGKVNHTYQDTGVYNMIIEVEDVIKRRDQSGLEILVNNPSPFGIFIDPRDNQEYKTMEIRNQTWFAENLNYYTTEGSSYYNNDSLANHQNGRLYTWHAGKFSCPEGWHMPRVEDWCELAKYYDETYPCNTPSGQVGETVSISIKDNGFLNRFPGYMNGETGEFVYKNESANFWISNLYSSPNNDRYIFRAIPKSEDYIFHHFTNPNFRFSVRPIKDD